MTGPRRRWRRAIAVGAVAAALAVGAAGCKRAPPVEVGSVRVAQGALADPLREAGLDEAALERSAKEALAAAGFKGGDATAGHRARVDVTSVRLGAARGGGGPQAEVTVEIDLVPPEGTAGLAARESGTGSASLAGTSPTQAWSRALERATRQAADGLAAAREESAKPTADVVKDLARPDPKLRAQAARVLAERRDPTAVPALLERLSDPEPEVMHRAVGALAQIRDPRAVGRLIDVSRRGDGALAARIARIIGDIGGPEARGYLLTIEAGHPDPRVQRAAREALDELAARELEPHRVAAGR